MPRRKLGVALAGGGPLGAIWEIGALVALDEALVGVDLVDCDVFVGVSAGAFIAAGLANGITPRAMHRMFIESAAADDPFEPDLLMHPAIAEYVKRLALLPQLLAGSVDRWFKAPWPHNLAAALGGLGRSLPTGVFDNAGIGDYLTELFSAPGRTNDFRALRPKLYLVATVLDTCKVVEFGGPGWDDVPISRAVQASSALPGLFPPIEIRGRHFVDGALTKTMHASIGLREGAALLLCINPLVPFDADRAAGDGQPQQTSIADLGLPAVLSQAFRAVIHSRVEVAMGQYVVKYPDADVLLFEPRRGDPDMFFANIFSYSARRRLCEHAYQETRADLRRRLPQLQRVFARHGLGLDTDVLADPHRTLLRPVRRLRKRQAIDLTRAALQLDHTLDDLADALPGVAAAPAARGGKRIVAAARSTRRSSKRSSGGVT